MTEDKNVVKMAKRLMVPLYGAPVVVMVVTAFDAPGITAISEFTGVPLRDLADQLLEGTTAATLHDNETGAHAVIFEYNDGVISLNMVLHESFHLAHTVAARHGVAFDSNNQEAVAYLAGYLGERLCSFFISAGIPLHTAENLRLDGPYNYGGTGECSGS